MICSPHTKLSGNTHGIAYCGAYGSVVLPGMQCPMSLPHGPLATVV